MLITIKGTSTYFLIVGMILYLQIAKPKEHLLLSEGDAFPIRQLQEREGFRVVLSRAQEAVRSSWGHRFRQGEARRKETQGRHGIRNKCSLGVSFLKEPPFFVFDGKPPRTTTLGTPTKRPAPNYGELIVTVKGSLELAAAARNWMVKWA